MIIIKPASVTASTLTSSNVAETDYPNWAAGTYVVGDRVIYDHRIWEVVAASTTDVPDAGAAAVPATWLFVSATNRYKMFDISVGSGTVNSGSINITITPATVANAVVLFDVDGSSAQLIVRDSGSTIVYDETVSLADYSGLNSYFNYYFLPIVETGATELALLIFQTILAQVFNLLLMLALVMLLAAN